MGLIYGVDLKPAGIMNTKKEGDILGGSGAGYSRASLAKSLSNASSLHLYPSLGNKGKSGFVKGLEPSLTCNLGLQVKDRPVQYRKQGL